MSLILSFGRDAFVEGLRTRRTGDIRGLYRLLSFLFSWQGSVLVFEDVVEDWGPT